MHFALIDNEKVEAQPGLKGLCPGCLQPVIPKCGTKKVHHWAHSSNVMCDSWWEPETEWHRSWKNNYPVDYQEIFMLDEQTGEKHIADVRTGHGFVIEFQHSHIDPQERSSREKFYKNMVWVVDGARFKRDYPRFLKGKEENFISSKTKGFFFTHFPDWCFPSNWIDSKVPVVFDFGIDISSSEPQDTIREFLWCLLPKRFRGVPSVVGAITRRDFITKTLTEPKFWILNMNYLRE